MLIPLQVPFSLCSNHPEVPFSYERKWHNPKVRYSVQVCEDAVTAYRLVHDFHRIVKGRLAQELDPWLQTAKNSGISAMQNFAFGIERDKAAVVAALSYEWSNGQVEGQVNRLKLRKRQLYGRASFDLLRRYVLDAP